MKRNPKKEAAARRIIKVGGLYRDSTRGVAVTAEDHEIRDGRRTGRVLVRAADEKLRFPRRWYCREDELAEVQAELLTRDGGGIP